MLSTITSDVANFITKSKYEYFSTEAKEQAKYCLLDWIGVTMMGALEEASQIVGHFVKEQDCKKEATILNKDFKTCVLFAVLVNGISGHVLDFDDAFPTVSGHPSATIMPATLAMAEKLGSSGVEMLKAIIIGFQVQFAIGEAIMPQHYNEGWHNTSTIGRFGATAAAASLLNMSTKDTINALGIAATTASGLKCVFGSMSKSFNAGKPGMDGILAALLADHGFDCVKDSLENKAGFINVFASFSDVNKLIKALESPLVIEGVRAKKYPSCYSTHPIIECMLSIHNKLGEAPKLSDIESLTYFIYPRCMEIATIQKPLTPLESRFSTQFCGAVALKKGNTMSIKDFGGENLKNDYIIELINKTKLIAVKEYEKNRKSKAVLEFKNGKKLEASVDLYKMMKDRIKGNESIVNKFNILLSSIKSLNSTKELKEAILNLENISNIKEELIPLINISR